MAAHQAPLSLGFSRQEYWSGLPFSSPMYEGEKWKWSRSVLFDSERPHGLQPTGLLCPWDFPGKSTGVGCHHLLWWRTVWRFLKKLKIELSYDLAILLLGMYLERTKTNLKRYMHPNAHSSTIIIYLVYYYIPRHGSNLMSTTDEWIEKMWYIYTWWNITQP